MDDIDLKLLFTKGEVFGFNKETTETTIRQALGDHFEIENYGSMGKFIHYENLRFSFSNQKLTGVDLFLLNSEDVYKCLCPEGSYSIDKNTSVLKIIHLFNLLGLKWEISYSKSRLDYLIIDISSGVHIFYYYEKEMIERISIFW